MFRSMVYSALGVALVVGLLLSAVQTLAVSPIIHAAEVFEITQPEAVLAHSDGHSHSHDEQEWGPEDGFERLAFTVLSNVLSAFGFAIILLTVMLLARDKAALKLSWTGGLGWGLAGYLTFFVAPALGLPPEIPGMEAAAIGGRQSWWVLVVLGTALGIASLVFLTGLARLMAIAFLAAPWLVGAPEPLVHGFLHPDVEALASLESLQEQFIYATAITNGLFWLTLGGLANYAASRFIKA